MSTRQISFAEALNEALREEMLRDETVYCIGEDIGVYGGDMGVTKGLIEAFGRERVRDTPISEGAIIGTSIGAAATGMRPVAEIMFDDFLGCCMDELLNWAAKMRYMFGGKAKIPLVVRSNMGAGVSAAAQHSQSLEAFFMHIPGLKVVMPSNPYDAKGLLKTAIRDDNPVMFFEHKMLYEEKGPVPEDEYTIPFGEADLKREGEDVTVVATSLMVHKALSAAEKLEQEGVDVEVIDPRTLVPLDKEAIIDSVKKTGRLVVVHESPKRCGAGAEIAAMVSEEAFDYLDAPIKRVAALNLPMPFSPVLEKRVLPQIEDIIKAIREVVS